MAERAGYEPLLAAGRTPTEDELESGGSPRFSSDPFLDNPPPDEAPSPLLGCEEDSELTWAAVHNLDDFFSQVYLYWEEKGFAVVLIARVLNLAALAFTISASWLLLLGVDYAALRSQCLKRDECNVWDVAIRRHPLAGQLTLWKALAVAYLLIFAGYWVFAVAHLVQEVRGLAEVRHFLAAQVGLSDRSVRSATWPEVASRLVAAQRTVRLCISRDLNEHDIVSRIMRRENYLVGMLNAGVLALNVPVPGLRRHLLLTKTVEWNLRWCVLDPMFDDKTFTVREEFVRDEAALCRRFRVMAVVNAIFSPFLLVFLVIYFFMKNAEALYHHPSAIGARRWSPVARWTLREFNELPHFIGNRLNAGHAAAERYVAQFPNHALSHAARFVAFVAGSFAAVLIALTLADERLLERDLAAGRQTVWWLALLGVVVAAARALIVEPSTASFDPERALLDVASHTHHLPPHWRGRAHTLEVQQEFGALFRYRAVLFLEELGSVVLTPVLLWHSLPRSAGSILQFVRRHTTRVDGVGDVCSEAAFCVRRRGGGAAGRPWDAATVAATDEAMLQLGREGKVEKSLVSFAAAYQRWDPPDEAQQFLSRVADEYRRGPASMAAAEHSRAWPGDSFQPGVHVYPPQFDFNAATQYQHQFQQQRQRQEENGRPSPFLRSSAIFGSAEALNGAAAGASTRPFAFMSSAPEEERVEAAQAMLQSYHRAQEAAAASPAEQHAEQPQQQQFGAEMAKPPPPQHRELSSELSVLTRERTTSGHQ